MKLKALCTSTVSLAVVGAVFATLYGDFTSWDDLIKTSPDIVIVRCTANPEPIVTDAGTRVAIDVEMILKGETKWGQSKLATQYFPSKGDRFLIFSTYDSNEHYQAYVALEKFRVVPIHFAPAELIDKPLAEQIMIVLRHRLDDLRNDASKQAAEERRRIERALSPRVPTPFEKPFGGRVIPVSEGCLLGWENFPSEADSKIKAMNPIP